MNLFSNSNHTTAQPTNNLFSNNQQATPVFQNQQNPIAPAAQLNIFSSSNNEKKEQNLIQPNQGTSLFLNNNNQSTVNENKNQPQNSLFSNVQPPKIADPKQASALFGNNNLSGVTNLFGNNKNNDLLDTNKKEEYKQTFNQDKQDIFPNNSNKDDKQPNLMQNKEEKQNSQTIQQQEKQNPQQTMQQQEKQAQQEQPNFSKQGINIPKENGLTESLFKKKDEQQQPKQQDKLLFTNNNEINPLKESSLDRPKSNRLQRKLNILKSSFSDLLSFLENPTKTPINDFKEILLDKEILENLKVPFNVFKAGSVLDNDFSNRFNQKNIQWHGKPIPELGMNLIQYFSEYLGCSNFYSNKFLEEYLDFNKELAIKILNFESLSPENKNIEILKIKDQLTDISVKLSLRYYIERSSQIKSNYLLLLSAISDNYIDPNYQRIIKVAQKDIFKNDINDLIDTYICISKQELPSTHKTLQEIGKYSINCLKEQFLILKTIFLYLATNEEYKIDQKILDLFNLFIDQRFKGNLLKFCKQRQPRMQEDFSSSENIASDIYDISTLIICNLSKKNDSKRILALNPESNFINFSFIKYQKQNYEILEDIFLCLKSLCQHQLLQSKSDDCQKFYLEQLREWLDRILKDISQEDQETLFKISDLYSFYLQNSQIAYQYWEQNENGLEILISSLQKFFPLYSESLLSIMKDLAGSREKDRVWEVFEYFRDLSTFTYRPCGLQEEDTLQGYTKFQVVTPFLSIPAKTNCSIIGYQEDDFDENFSVLFQIPFDFWQAFGKEWKNILAFLLKGGEGQLHFSLKEGLLLICKMIEINPQILQKLEEQMFKGKQKFKITSTGNLILILMCQTFYLYTFHDSKDLEISSALLKALSSCMEVSQFQKMVGVSLQLVLQIYAQPNTKNLLQDFFQLINQFSTPDIIQSKHQFIVSFLTFVESLFVNCEYPLEIFPLQSSNRLSTATYQTPQSEILTFTNHMLQQVQWAENEVELFKEKLATSVYLQDGSTILPELLSITFGQVIDYYDRSVFGEQYYPYKLEIGSKILSIIKFCLSQFVFSKNSIPIYSSEIIENEFLKVLVKIFNSNKLENIILEPLNTKVKIENNQPTQELYNFQVDYFRKISQNVSNEKILKSFLYQSLECIQILIDLSNSFNEIKKMRTQNSSINKNLISEIFLISHFDAIFSKISQSYLFKSEFDNKKIEINIVMAIFNLTKFEELTPVINNSLYDSLEDINQILEKEKNDPCFVLSTNFNHSKNLFYPKYNNDLNYQKLISSKAFQVIGQLIDFWSNDYFDKQPILLDYLSNNSVDFSMQRSFIRQIQEKIHQSFLDIEIKEEECQYVIQFLRKCTQNQQSFLEVYIPNNQGKRKQEGTFKFIHIFKDFLKDLINIMKKNPNCDTAFLICETVAFIHDLKEKGKKYETFINDLFTGDVLEILFSEILQYYIPQTFDIFLQNEKIFMESMQEDIQSEFWEYFKNYSFIRREKIILQKLRGENCISQVANILTSQLLSQNYNVIEVTQKFFQQYFGKWLEVALSDKSSEYNQDDQILEINRYLKSKSGISLQDRNILNKNVFIELLKFPGSQKGLIGRNFFYDLHDLYFLLKTFNYSDTLSFSVFTRLYNYNITKSIVYIRKDLLENLEKSFSFILSLGNQGKGLFSLLPANQKDENIRIFSKNFFVLFNKDSISSFDNLLFILRNCMYQENKENFQLFSFKNLKLQIFSQVLKGIILCKEDNPIITMPADLIFLIKDYIIQISIGLLQTNTKVSQQYQNFSNFILQFVILTLKFQSFNYPKLEILTILLECIQKCENEFFNFSLAFKIIVENDQENVITQFYQQDQQFVEKILLKYQETSNYQDQLSLILLLKGISASQEGCEILHYSNFILRVLNNTQSFVYYEEGQKSQFFENYLQILDLLSIYCQNSKPSSKYNQNGTIILNTVKKRIVQLFQKILENSQEKTFYLAQLEETFYTTQLLSILFRNLKNIRSLASESIKEIVQLLILGCNNIIISNNQFQPKSQFELQLSQDQEIKESLINDSNKKGSGTSYQTPFRLRKNSSHSIDSSSKRIDYSQFHQKNQNYSLFDIMIEQYCVKISFKQLRIIQCFLEQNLFVFFDGQNLKAFIKSFYEQKLFLKNFILKWTINEASLNYSLNKILDIAYFYEINVQKTYSNLKNIIYPEKVLQNALSTLTLFYKVSGTVLEGFKKERSIKENLQIFKEKISFLNNQLPRLKIAINNFIKHYKKLIVKIFRIKKKCILFQV